MNLGKKVGIELLVLGCCLALGAAVPARNAYNSIQEPPADNSKANQRDRNSASPTADQQKMTPADRELTKKIRASLTSDKSLSTYAHNVKVIAQDGKVTLRGPVRSADEKATVESKATEIAGAGNVTNLLEVAPPKS